MFVSSPRGTVATVCQIAKAAAQTRSNWLPCRSLTQVALRNVRHLLYRQWFLIRLQPTLFVLPPYAPKDKGAAGPSGIDAHGWRRLCTSFKIAAYDLCHALAAIAKRLCTSLVDPKGLSPLSMSSNRECGPSRLLQGSTLVQGVTLASEPVF